jgi:hypothetical protein
MQCASSTATSATPGGQLITNRTACSKVMNSGVTKSTVTWSYFERHETLTFKIFNGTYFQKFTVKLPLEQ